MALRNDARPKARFSARAAGLALALVTLAVGFEVIVRLVDGVDFGARNFVAERLSLLGREHPGIYDKDLGYVPAPGYDGTPAGWSARVTIDEASLRQNGPGAPAPAQAAVLAAGGSQTFGDRVSDPHTWPAQLQGLLGQPVANAGVFGYGLDQAVLRAEKLVASYRPLALAVSFVYGDVRRAQLVQRNGTEKPYFDVVDGRLALRNVPPGPHRPRLEQMGAFRAVLGYSYLADWTARQAGLTDRWYARGFSEVRAHGNGLQVGCLLMQRLRNVQESSGAVVLVIALYEPRDLIAPNGPTSVEDLAGSARLLQCAARNGLAVLDTLPALKARYRADPAVFAGRYFDETVPSAAGHRLVAEQVADALALAFAGG